MESPQRDGFEHLEQDAILAELARPLVHEFNNFLNSLLLQIAILRAKTPELEPSGLDPLRKEALRIAGLLQEWQNLPRDGSAEQRIDLNQTVREIVPDGLAVSLKLTSEPLWTRSSPCELRRLYSLLLKVCTRQSRGHEVVVRTENGLGQAVLSLHSKGDNWAPSALEDAFNLSDHSDCGLILAGCKSLADRLHGRLVLENHREGGLLIAFALPATS